MDLTSLDPELDAAEVKKQRKAAKRAAAELAPPAAKDAGDDANAEAKKIRKAAKRANAEAAAAELLLEHAVDADVAAAKKERKASTAAAREAAAAAEAGRTWKQRDLEAAEAKKARKLAKRASAEAETLAKDGDDEVDRQEPSMKKRKMEVLNRETLKDTKQEVLSKGNKELEVVVLGLSPKTASADVRSYFSECGEVIDFRMPLSDEGGNKGIAFIEYKDAASCAEALKLSGREYGCRFLVVRMALDASGKDGKGKGKRSSKEFEVFIGGLPWNVTEESVRKDFSECGEILALRMPLTKSGLYQGVAFIEYGDKESADKAVKFNATDYGGRWLDVRMTLDAPPSKDKSKTTGINGKGAKGCNELEVFVGGLPSTMTEDGLKQAFAKCGEIDTLKMPVPRESDTRRIAFIKFKEKDACSEALKLSETDMGGLRINVRMSGSSGSQGKTKGGKDGKGKGKGKGKKGKK